MKTRYLVLENGACFEGLALGADGERIGELVFRTSVTGYMEALTDPAVYGQLLMETFPLIGNYGHIEQDAEGPCRAFGYVTRSCCQAPSNFRSEGDLDTYLKENGVVGITGVDTRAITRLLRQSGGMNAMLTDTPPTDLSALASYRVRGAAEAVSCKEPYTLAATGATRYRVAVLDLGLTRSLAKELTDRGCELTVFPCNTKADTILGGGFDGVLLSDGGGDPHESADRIREVGLLFGRLPILAVGQGHLILALSRGASCEKMKQGHRGANQPVRDLAHGITYITSQFHGYTVVTETVREGEVRFYNVNDGGCEGIDYGASGALSLQFRPITEALPRSSGDLFDEFLLKMGGR